MDKGIVYIGMDLGTFKTSVTSSAGVRDVIPTAVGWPKDHISRTLLGRDVVFGDEIYENRMALNVVRPFVKGILKYGEHGADELSPEQVEMHREAARLVVKRAVALTRPPQGAPIYGVIGAPARANIHNKKFLLEAAADTFDGAMIVSEPFAIAYGMNRLHDTLIVDIGAGTTDICPLYGVFPSEEEQITLPIGGDLVDEDFQRRINQMYPEAQLTINMAREIKEKYGFVHDVNETAVVTLPIDGRPHRFDVTEPLKAACRTLVGPIVEKLANLIARFDPEFQQRMLGNILLGGGGSQLKGLDRTIEAHMSDFGNVKVTKVYDPVFAGSVGALKLAMNMPRDYFETLKQESAAQTAVA